MPRVDLNTFPVGRALLAAQGEQDFAPHSVFEFVYANFETAAVQEPAYKVRRRTVLCLFADEAGSQYHLVIYRRKAGRQAEPPWRDGMRILYGVDASTDARIVDVTDLLPIYRERLEPMDDSPRNYSEGL